MIVSESMLKVIAHKIDHAKSMNISHIGYTYFDMHVTGPRGFENGLLFKSSVFNISPSS